MKELCSHRILFTYMWCFVRTVCYYCFYFWKPFSYFFIHIIKSYTVMNIAGRNFYS